MVESELRVLTEKLLVYMDRLLEQYNYTKDHHEKSDFTLVVKPFADEIKNVNDDWFAEANKWVIEKNPKHIHLKQIQSTYDQIELLSVQAFFPETSRTRFLNYWNSVRYLLIDIIDKQ